MTHICGAFSAYNIMIAIRRHIISNGETLRQNRSTPLIGACGSLIAYFRPNIGGTMKREIRLTDIRDAALP